MERNEEKRRGRHGRDAQVEGSALKPSEGQISALYDGEFGELQGELREDAENVGFQQELQQIGNPAIDQYGPRPQDREEEQQRNLKSQKNRPRPS